jgi:hypothetical protein
MGAPAVTILSDLTEAMVDAALARGEGGVSGFAAALERYRDAGAPGALLLWRRRHLASAADRRAIDVLARLQRDLLIGLAA